MKEYVIRFEIPVHDVVLVQDFEGLQQLSENLESSAFGEVPLLFQQRLQRLAVAELVDEVEVIGCFEHLDVTDDELVRLDLRQDVDFVYRALL
jgi:hypothetical protein